MPTLADLIASPGRITTDAEPPAPARRKRRSKLVAAAREKYGSAYDHIDDDTLQAAILRKYPGVYDSEAAEEEPEEPSHFGVKAAAMAARVGIPVIGAIAGGAAGTFVGPGPGTAAGAAAGGAVFGAAGEFLGEKIEEWGGLRPEGVSGKEVALMGGLNALPLGGMARNLGIGGRAVAESGAVRALAKAVGAEGLTTAAPKMIGSAAKPAVASVVGELGGRAVGHGLTGAAIGSGSTIATVWLREAEMLQQTNPDLSFVDALQQATPTGEAFVELAKEGGKWGSIFGAGIGGAMDTALARVAANRRAQPTWIEGRRTADAPEGYQRRLPSKPDLIASRNALREDLGWEGTPAELTRIAEDELQTAPPELQARYLARQRPEIDRLAGLERTLGMMPSEEDIAGVAARDDRLRTLVNRPMRADEADAAGWTAEAGWPGQTPPAPAAAPAISPDVPVVYAGADLSNTALMAAFTKASEAAGRANVTLAKGYWNEMVKRGMVADGAIVPEETAAPRPPRTFAAQQKARASAPPPASIFQTQVLGAGRKLEIDPNAGNEVPPPRVPLTEGPFAPKSQVIWAGDVSELPIKDTKNAGALDIRVLESGPETTMVEFATKGGGPYSYLGKFEVPNRLIAPRPTEAPTVPIESPTFGKATMDLTLDEWADLTPQERDKRLRFMSAEERRAFYERQNSLTPQGRSDDAIAQRDSQLDAGPDEVRIGPEDRNAASVGEVRPEDAAAVSRRQGIAQSAREGGFPGTDEDLAAAIAAKETEAERWLRTTQEVAATRGELLPPGMFTLDWALDAVGVYPGNRWWESAAPVGPIPSQLQSLLEPPPAAAPAPVPAAPIPTQDVTPAGTQPRLPGDVGAVRQQNITTPALATVQPELPVPPPAPPAEAPSSSLMDLLRKPVPGLPQPKPPTPLETVLAPPQPETPQTPGSPPVQPAAAPGAASRALTPATPLPDGMGEVVAPADRDFVQVKLTREFADANPDVKAALKADGFKYYGKWQAWIKNRGETAPDQALNDAMALVSSKRAIDPVTGEPAPVPAAQPPAPVAPFDPAKATTAPPEGASFTAMLRGKLGRPLPRSRVTAQTPEELQARGPEAQREPDPIAAAVARMSAGEKRAFAAGQKARFETGEAAPKDAATARRAELTDAALEALLDDANPESIARFEQALNDSLEDRFGKQTRGGTQRWPKGGLETRAGEQDIPDPFFGKAPDTEAGPFSAAAGPAPYAAYLFRQHPDVMRRLGYGIIGSFMLSDKDSEDGYWNVGSLQGFALGFAGPAALRYLRKTKPGAAVTKVAREQFDITSGKGVPTVPERTARGLKIAQPQPLADKPGVQPVRLTPDYSKDMDPLRTFLPGSIEGQIPEFFPAIEKVKIAQEEAIKRLNETARRTGVNPTGEDIWKVKKETGGELSKELRRRANAIKKEQPRRALIYEAAANDLLGTKTLSERGFARMGVKPYTLRRAVNWANGITYATLLNWGVDTAAANVLQPILASADVPWKYLKDGFGELASEIASGQGRQGPAWKKTQFLKMDKPVELQAESGSLVPAISKNPKIQQAYEWVQKVDPSILLSSGDNWNRRGVFLGALAYAVSRGETEVAAREWALQVVRKSQGASGTRMNLSNPLWRDPMLQLLKPFTRYPAMFVEVIADEAAKGGPGLYRLLATIGSLAALGGVLHVDLQQSMMSGSRPLGFDPAHPIDSFERLIRGEATPTTRGIKDAYAHITGKPQTHKFADFTSVDDFLESDLPNLIPVVGGRYPVKLAKTALQAARGQEFNQRTSTGKPDPKTGGETLLNLLGFKSTKQSEQGKGLRRMSDELYDESQQQRADTAIAKQQMLRAYDRGDMDTAMEIARAAGFTAEQVKNIAKTRNQDRATQMFRSLSKKERARFNQKHPDWQKYRERN